MTGQPEVAYSEVAYSEVIYQLIMQEYISWLNSASAKMGTTVDGQGTVPASQPVRIN